MVHAWETERKILEEGIPVVLSEEEQSWAAMAGLEKAENVRLSLLWESHVPGSYALEKVLYGAVQSMENMGYDVSKALPLLEAGEKAFSEKNMSLLSKITHEIHMMLNDLPRDEKHPYHSYKIYDTFEQYASVVELPEAVTVAFDDTMYDRMHAGWQAQIAGGANGTAIEGYTLQNIEKTFGQIHDYVRKPNTMNDDITFELAFLLALEEKGAAVTSRDIALEWVAQVPFGWSAEDVALRNLHLGIAPPQSGYANNPFREWIGAQMRGAICGMVAPGNPKLAADFAWRDAVVSHHNNGVLGEVFNAILASLAFCETDMRVLTQKCVDLMPKDSEYGDVVRFALEACKKTDDWRTAWAQCDQKYYKYNWVHAYPNACAQVVALWFGNGDFEDTMHIICMEGVDVDCNAAQILTAVGIMHGTSCIDPKWTAPIGDDLETYTRDIKHISIRELVRRTVEAAKKAQAK